MSASQGQLILTPRGQTEAEPSAAECPAPPLSPLFDLLDRLAAQSEVHRNAAWKLHDHGKHNDANYQLGFGHGLYKAVNELRALIAESGATDADTAERPAEPREAPR